MMDEPVIRLVTKTEQAESERKTELDEFRAKAWDALRKLGEQYQAYGIRSFMFITIDDQGVWRSHHETLDADRAALIGATEVIKSMMVHDQIADLIHED